MGLPSCGRTSAATAPPTGTAVCRMPSASPRSCAENQPITARPLPDWTLPPAIPASPRRTTSHAKLGAYAAAARSTAQAASPPATVHRSPKRSTAKPHGSSANVRPIHSAESTIPISVRLRSYWSRSAGASTAIANETVEKLACAAVPAARTAQRYDKA